MRYEPEVISKNIKRKQKIKRVLIIVLYLMLIPTIIFSLFLIAVELGNSKEVPSSFNIEIYTITSESMSPRIKVNDIIVVKKGYENDKYKIGNIITFRNVKNEVITHRIEKIANIGGERSYITKGDNNEVEDSELVKYENIIGKVIYVMPRFGNFVSILKNKIFFGTCVALLVFVIYNDIRLTKKKLERKKVREKYEKKSDFYF